MKNKELEIENHKEDYAELLTSYNELFKASNEPSKQSKNLEYEDDMRTISSKSLMSRNIPMDNFKAYNNEEDIQQNIEDECLKKIGQEREKYEAEIEDLQEEIAQRVESEKQKYEEVKNQLQDEILKLKSDNEDLVFEIKSLQETETARATNLEEEIEKTEILENDIKKLKIEKQEFQTEAENVIGQLNKKIHEINNEKELMLENIEVEKQQLIKQNELRNSEAGAESIEAKETILKLTEDLNEANEGKNSLERQLTVLHDDIRTYEVNSANTTSKYEQQLRYFEEQLQLYQVSFYF